MHRAIHLQGCFSHPETWDGSGSRLDVREERTRSEGPARDGLRKVGTSLVAQWSVLPAWGGAASVLGQGAEIPRTKQHCPKK